MSNIKTINAALGSLCAAMVLSACTPATYSIGGTIPSLNGGQGMEKAQFSLSGDSCGIFEDVPPTGSMTYHDKSVFNPNGKGAGLQLTTVPGELILIDCSNPAALEICDQVLDLIGVTCTTPVKGYFANYVSTNTENPGEGTLFGFACDNGQGHLQSSSYMPDSAGIIIVSGPYIDYKNAGPVKGNVTTGVCPLQ